MLSNLKKYQLILASNSPRRKELMSGLGVEYVVRTLPDVDDILKLWWELQFPNIYRVKKRMLIVL